MKRLLILTTLLTVILTAHGRYRQTPKDFTDPLRSNMNIGLHCGTGALTANAALGSPTSLGLNTGIDVDYTYLFNNFWGIRFGTDFVFSTSGFHADGVETQTMGEVELYDGSGTTVTRLSHYTFTTPSVNETYTAVLAQVPIQLSFRYKHFFFDVGAKAVIPLGVTASYQYGATEIGVGYDIDGTGSHLEVPIPCGTLEPQKGKYSLSEAGGLSFPLWVSLSFDIGYRIPLKLHQLLYIGFNMDYSLNRPTLGGENELITFEYGSPRFNNIASTRHLSQLGYFSFGLKIQYSFTFGRRANNQNNPFLP